MYAIFIVSATAKVMKRNRGKQSLVKKFQTRLVPVSIKIFPHKEFRTDEAGTLSNQGSGSFWIIATDTRIKSGIRGLILIPRLLYHIFLPN
jgi:hypothetical protein